MSTPDNDRKPGEPVAWRCRKFGEFHGVLFSYLPTSPVFVEHTPLVPLSDYTAEVARREAAAGAKQARHGIYIASKTKHAKRWKELRAAGYPIISTWIDEAGAGESEDLSDLWDRCIAEASGCSLLVLYREPDDVLKGGWVELGAALANGVPVHAVGIEGFTIQHHRGIKHFDTIEAALASNKAGE